MYCIKCGVELADTEKHCPLCGTIVFHPEIAQPAAKPLYPANQLPEEKGRSIIAHILLAAVFLLPMLITLQCDLLLNRRITWSGYVAGALIVAYTVFVLPGWFVKPNPVIFAPVSCAVISVYLLYICFATDGDWFLSFALPVMGFLTLLLSALITLLRCTKRGEYYIVGGATILLGLFMPLLEHLIQVTFRHVDRIVWSLYPLTVLIMLGGFLLFLAICRPARELMERKFFI